MTTFEWKCKDGWIWIADNPNKSESNPAEFAVYVDPTDYANWYFNEAGRRNQAWYQQQHVPDAALEHRGTTHLVDLR